MVHIYRKIIFYTIRSFVLSNRVCEAGLHLRTDLFLEVLTQAGESGAPPIQRVRSKTLISMQGRHCLGKIISLSRTKLNLFEGLSFDQCLYYRQDCYPDVSDRNLSLGVIEYRADTEHEISVCWF